MPEIKEVGFKLLFDRPAGRLVDDLRGYFIRHDGQEYCLGYRTVTIHEETIPLITGIYRPEGGHWYMLSSNEIQEELGLTVRKDGSTYRQSAGAIFQILMIGLQAELNKKQP